MFSPFDAVGTLSFDTYDALVPPPWSSAALLPETRSVVVLANGGPAFVSTFLATPHTGADPLDAYTVAQVERVQDALSRQGHKSAAAFYWEKRADTYADFQAIAAAAGLGGPSKLGLLVHPVFGPWIAIRALLFTDKHIPPHRAPPYEPCTGCPAPCERACPVAAVGFPFQQAACADRRQRDPCRQRCDARIACVIGRDYAYDEAVQAFHSHAALKTPDPS